MDMKYFVAIANGENGSGTYSQDGSLTSRRLF
jgi:hypothetical protein